MNNFTFKSTTGIIFSWLSVLMVMLGATCSFFGKRRRQNFWGFLYVSNVINKWPKYWYLNLFLPHSITQISCKINVHKIATVRTYTLSVPVSLLPPAYGVWREGNVFSLSVHRGGQGFPPNGGCPRDTPKWGGAPGVPPLGGAQGVPPNWGTPQLGGGGHPPTGGGAPP